jgi:hypothetical protein
LFVKICMWLSFILLLICPIVHPSRHMTFIQHSVPAGTIDTPIWKKNSKKNYVFKDEF